MSIKQEILLVYHSADNQPIARGSSKGWVTNFHKFLTTLLKQIAGRDIPVTLVSESECQVEQFWSNAILISVLSKDFMSDPVLMNGFHLFVSAAQEKNTLIIDSLSSVFKVIKFPLNTGELIPEYADILSYDFYHIDPLTGEPQEFKRFFENKAERSYWMKMVDMAYDLYQILNKLEEGGDKRQLSSIVDKEKTIYLANVGVDMIIQRDTVKRELIRHGYKVLPNLTLPKEIDVLERSIKNDLDQCCLSIHLIGEDYGYKPIGSDFSVVDVQNQLASKHTKHVHEYNLKHQKVEKFSRLIWLSPELKHVSERQKIFIEDIKSDAATLNEAEVLQIPLQELKSIIREELITGGRFKTKKIQTKNQLSKDGNLVYLICDQQDVERIDSIIKYIKSKEINVVASVFDGNVMEIRHLHQENLRRCDASLVYYGKSSSAEWIQAKLQDFLKMPGFGRTKPMKVVAIFVEDKAKLPHIRMSSIMVLEDGDFSPEKINPFLEKLK